mmetsp:Transcript_4231/g.7532  ORF Transcript_4231/g.7532 Transcript_4231/m.7532 type:complete len:245 (-) Transcript_4231:1961-2695(-)
MLRLLRQWLRVRWGLGLILRLRLRHLRLLREWSRQSGYSTSVSLVIISRVLGIRCWLCRRIRSWRRYRCLCRWSSWRRHGPRSSGIAGVGDAGLVYSRIRGNVASGITATVIVVVRSISHAAISRRNSPTPTGRIRGVAASSPSGALSLTVRRFGETGPSILTPITKAVVHHVRHRVRRHIAALSHRVRRWLLLWLLLRLLELRLDIIHGRRTRRWRYIVRIWYRSLYGNLSDAVRRRIGSLGL